VKLSLREKALAVALLNACVLAAILVWFGSTQLKQSVGTLMIGEARERLTNVALQIGRELRSTPLKGRDAMFERYSREHGVTFRLYHLNGVQLAGPPAELPAELKVYLREMRAKTPLLERPENIARVIRNSGAVPKEDNFMLGGQEMERLLAVVTDPPFLVRADGAYWVTLRMPARASDMELFQPTQLVYSSDSFFFGTPFFFDLRPWLGLLALIVLAAIACWWPFVRSVTRTIGTLADATEQISKGRLSQRVDIRRGDELGRLAQSFNRMAGQLEGFVKGQKGFLRDAAHELRSPIARMQAALGNIMETPDGAEKDALLEDLREEIEVMSSLTGELLTFAREDNARSMLTLAPVSLSEIAARVVATENPAGTPPVRVEVPLHAQVVAHPDSLFRGLSNVVRNAINYAGKSGPITVSAERHEDATIVTVKDQGPGIPEESLEMVFTPFYRLDASRDRETGGNGLGMSIARSCFEACKGTIRCRNRNPGLEVIITLQSA
jgi:two-component system sensor histidine kinase CpxA